MKKVLFFSLGTILFLGLAFFFLEKFTYWRGNQKPWGKSLLDQCNVSSDCGIGGNNTCNEQICGRKNPQGFHLGCFISGENARQAGYECNCIKQKCQWKKKFWK